MAQQQTRIGLGRGSTAAAPRPRLRLKPKVRRIGHVDGAWWPRGDNLMAELPDLLALLSVRLGPIECVTYHLNEWSNVPAKCVIGGRTVRLSGYRYQPIHTVEVLGRGPNRLALLVVAPYSDPDNAHTTMMAAAGPENAATVDELLTLNRRYGQRRPQSDYAQERWESEGGPTGDRLQIPVGVG